MLLVQIDLERSKIKCCSGSWLRDIQKTPTLTFFSLKTSSVLQDKQFWKEKFDFSSLRILLWLMLMSCVVLEYTLNRLSYIF